jgi:hypothetical protein
VVELILQGILRETFKNTAYNTISYIQHDTALLAALRRGDLLIKLNFLQGQHDNETSVKRSGSAKRPAAKRRKSSSQSEQKTHDEPNTADDHSHLVSYVDDDFIEDEPQADLEIEFDEDDDRRHSKRESLEPIDDDFEVSQSSEDTPILKRLKKGPPTRPPPAAAASASSRPSIGQPARGQPQSSDFVESDDFLESAALDENRDDEEAYQDMIMASAQYSYD